MEYKVLKFIFEKSIDEGIDTISPEVIKSSVFKNDNKAYEKCMAFLITQDYIKVHHPLVYGVVSLSEDYSYFEDSGIHSSGEIEISITTKGKSFLHETSARRKTIGFITKIAAPLVVALIMYFLAKLLAH